MLSAIHFEILRHFCTSWTYRMDPSTFHLYLFPTVAKKILTVWKPWKTRDPEEPDDHLEEQQDGDCINKERQL